jgi:hypothetical protein
MPDKFVPLGFVVISIPPLVVLHNLNLSVFSVDSVAIKLLLRDGPRRVMS